MPSSWPSRTPGRCRRRRPSKIAKITGAKLEEVPQLLKGYVFPTLEEQASDKFLGGGTVKAIEATSAFLKEQGKIDAVLPDYSQIRDRQIRHRGAGLELNARSSQTPRWPAPEPLQERFRGGSALKDLLRDADAAARARQSLGPL